MISYCTLTYIKKEKLFKLHNLCRFSCHEIVQVEITWKLEIDNNGYAMYRNDVRMYSE